MVPKKIKSAIVEKSDSASYMKRAKELLESMRNNIIIENWNATVIDGVHAAISMNDALTVMASGKRSTGDSHYDAVELLKQSIPQNMDPDLSRLRRIVGIKSHVEYGPSLVTEKEAKSVVQDVERFFSWAEETYKKISR